MEITLPVCICGPKLLKEKVADFSDVGNSNLISLFLQHFIQNIIFGGARRKKVKGRTRGTGVVTRAKGATSTSQDFKTSVFLIIILQGQT